MSEKLETVQLAPRENAFLGVKGYPSEKPFSEETSRAMDGEVLRIINESHEETRRLLTKHRKELDALASAAPAGSDAKATCSAWREAQDLLAAHLDAKHITHTKSGHFIQGENPKLVVASVRKVVGAARKKVCALGVKNHGQCIKAEKHARRY